MKNIFPFDTPPEPRAFHIRKRTRQIHGHTVRDSFHGLEDESSPQTRAYIAAESKYARRVLRHTNALSVRFQNEMKAHIPAIDESLPFTLRGYAYFSRSYAEKDYPLYFRRPCNSHDEPTLMLDLNLLAQNKKVCLLSGMAISPDSNILAYGVNFTGGISYEIRFLNLQTQAYLPDVIRNTDGDPVFSEDGAYVFYVKRERGNLRGSKIMRHKLGTPVQSDICVFHEKDESFDCSVWKTKSDRYIIFSASSSDSAEHHFIFAADPLASPTLIAPRKEHVEYYPEDHGDFWFILTNDEAPDFTIIVTSIKNTLNNSRVCVPHVAGRLIDDFEIFDSALVYLVREHAQFKLIVYPLTDAVSPREIFFDGETLAFDVNPNIFEKEIRFVRTSMVLPNTIVSYNFESGQQNILKVANVVNYHSEEYETHRIFAPSRDGVTQIPVTLAWRRDCFAPGKIMPMYLRGYGAYGISSDPAFRSSIISLLDRGFVSAVAHVRGGEEMGREWYLKGKLSFKQNSFSDFIDVAQFLVNEKFTSSEMLAIGGGSAGGLLMGAVINQAPQLFKLAVMDVPFVDVINTMLNPELPLTTGEYNEWGNPRVREDYFTILKYAPYENITKQKYPILFITGNRNDDQVPYWEPLKFAAKVRALNPKSQLIVRILSGSGHLGPTGKNAEIKEIATELSFIAQHLLERDV